MGGPTPAPVFSIQTQKRGADMAEGRERNQEMKHGTGPGDRQQAPGRNPEDDRAAGEHRGGEKREPKRGEFDPDRGGGGGAPKERGPKEKSRRQKRGEQP